MVVLENQKNSIIFTIENWQKWTRRRKEREFHQVVYCPIVLLSVAPANVFIYLFTVFLRNRRTKGFSDDKYNRLFDDLLKIGFHPLAQKKERNFREFCAK